MPTLLMSSRYTEDSQALWQAAVDRGWDVERYRPNDPMSIDDRVIIYMEGMFAKKAAEENSVTLDEPADNWLFNMPYDLAQRNIYCMKPSEVRHKLMQGEGRIKFFVKPIGNNKSFPSQVYGHPDSGWPVLEDYVDDESHENVLVSDPRNFSVEYRCFIINNKVKTLSPYKRVGVCLSPDNPDAPEFGYDAPEEEIEDAISFAEQVLYERWCPYAFVLDIGQLPTGEWCVIEANPAWSSGIYGCDPNAVLDVLQAATQPKPKYTAKFFSWTHSVCRTISVGTIGTQFCGLIGGLIGGFIGFVSTLNLDDGDN